MTAETGSSPYYFGVYAAHHFFRRVKTGDFSKAQEILVSSHHVLNRLNHAQTVALRKAPANQWFQTDDGFPDENCTTMVKLGLMEAKVEASETLYSLTKTKGFFASWLAKTMEHADHSTSPYGGFMEGVNRALAIYKAHPINEAPSLVEEILESLRAEASSGSAVENNILPGSHDSNAGKTGVDADTSTVSSSAVSDEVPEAPAKPVKGRKKAESSRLEVDPNSQSSEKSSQDEVALPVSKSNKANLEIPQSTETAEEVSAQPAPKKRGRKPKNAATPNLEQHVDASQTDVGQTDVEGFIATSISEASIFQSESEVDASIPDVSIPPQAEVTSEPTETATNNPGVLDDSNQIDTDELALIATGAVLTNSDTQSPQQPSSHAIQAALPKSFARSADPNIILFHNPEDLSEEEMEKLEIQSIVNDFDNILLVAANLRGTGHVDQKGGSQNEGVTTHSSGQNPIPHKPEIKKIIPSPVYEDTPPTAAEKYDLSHIEPGRWFRIDDVDLVTYLSELVATGSVESRVVNGRKQFRLTRTLEPVMAA